MRHRDLQRSRRPLFARSGALLGMTLLAFLAVACGAPENRSGAGGTAAPGEEAPPADPNAPREYEARGRVTRLTAEGKEIFIHHEAILDFVGIDGSPEPMSAMTMPFPLAPELARQVVAGDPIRFRFRVDWDGAKPLEVIAIEKLPPETRLAFEKAEP